MCTCGCVPVSVCVQACVHVWLCACECVCVALDLARLAERPGAISYQLPLSAVVGGHDGGAWSVLRGSWSGAEVLAELDRYPTLRSQ